MKVFFRDPRFARRTFKTEKSILDGLPKAKFLYFVRFSLGVDLDNPSLKKEINSVEKGISFLVQRVDRPKINFETETMIQYNKKRVIQKSHKFDPITIVFYDTYDDRVIGYFLDYYKHYYGEPRASNIKPWVGDSTEVEMEAIRPFGVTSDANSWFGYNPPFVGSLSGIDVLNEAISKSRHFNYIDIITFGCNVASSYRLVNPVITRFDPGEMDATDVASVSTTTIQVEYEAVIFPEELLLQSSITKDLRDLLQNGENSDSDDSAWLPPDTIQTTYFPTKFPGINVEINNSRANSGLDRLIPNQNRSLEESRPSNNRIVESVISSLGGLNFGRSLTDNRFRTGISSINNAIGFNSLTRPIQNISSKISSFRIPGLNPLLNSVENIPQGEVYVQNKNINAFASGNLYDLCIGLAQNMGIKDKETINSIAAEIANISKRTGLSPIEVVKRYNLSPEIVDKADLGVLAVSAKNRNKKDFSTQYAFIGNESSDYNWNISVHSGVQIVGYDSEGYPINQFGRRIDNLGREVDNKGNLISNPNPDSGMIKRVFPGQGVPEDISWKGTDKSVDFRNIEKILKNS